MNGVELISEKLSGFYTALEDKYFNFLDALDHRGIPVYAYSDFFEEKGVPSFIVTIAIIIALLLVVSIAFTGIASVGEITIVARDNSGQPLQNITLSIATETGVVLINSETVSNGQTINIVPQSVGTKLVFSATKQGYHPTTDETIIGDEEVKGELFFEKEFLGINGRVRLIDSENGTKVSDASVSARYLTNEFTAHPDGNGLFVLGGVPEGTSVLLKVNAEGYLEIEQEASFSRDSIKDLIVVPDSSSFQGKANVIFNVVDPSGNAVDGALITVNNNDNQIVLLEAQTIGGQVLGSISTGIPLKIVIEKEGYLLYDSDLEGTSVTLRKAEEKIDLYLKAGGERLIVDTYNELGLTLSDSIVQIFSPSGERIAREITTTNGAEFNGLDARFDYLITADRDGYLPNGNIVRVGETESASIILREETSVNSTRLDFITTDTSGVAVARAQIKVLQFVDGNKIPYGLDDFATSIGGYASAIVEKGKTYEVLAETDVLEGRILKEVGEDVYDTKVYLQMRKKPRVIELILRDIYGDRVTGNGIVSALDGTTLFDGNILGSKIFFDAENREVIELMVETDDGNTFTTNIVVNGKDTIEVTIYDRTSNGLSPQIEFVGLENEEGNEVQGITPGEFYLAKFEVAFPVTSDTGGLHVRAGTDNINFVDSGNFAVFDLVGASEKFFSYSYTPSPLPGNEVVDRSNEGLAGEANKWVEGVMDNPSGTYIVKAKIRASDFTAGKVVLKYRAWARLGEDYYRSPEDIELGFNAVTEEKGGLYADTKTEEITLYESLPECNDTICVALKFVDSDGQLFETANFEALTGKQYALEAEFVATEGDYLQLSVSSDNNVSFISTQTSTFSFSSLPSSSKNELTTTLSLNQNGKQKIRFYFLPGTIGPNVINFKSIGNGIIERDVSFNTVREKELIVELNNSTVQLGRNFNVKVLDEGLRGIENALIKFVDNTGTVTKSVTGNGAEGNGRNGNYRIENNLDTGVYIVNVHVDQYKTNETPLLITTSSVLTVTPELEAKMLFEETTKILTMDVTNNSEFAIRNLSADASDSENYRVQIFTQGIINSGQTQKVQVKVDFIGEAENADETITIFVKGMVEGKFFVQENSSLHAIYNRELDNDCLELRPGNVTINLIGKQGANDTETIEAINNCEIAINLEHRTVENTRQSYILVKSEDISLQPGQTKNITITANNLVERQYHRNNSFSYDIVYDSNYLTKRLSVTVKLINPTLALSYPGQITLFLAKDKPGGAATAAQPIFVSNRSQFPIEGLRFSIEKEYATQTNVRISVEPSGVVSLNPGESISPPKLVFAEASSKLTGPAKARIYIRGSLANLNNRVGTNDRYDYQALFANSYAPTSGQGYSNLGNNNQSRYQNNYSNPGTLGYYGQSNGYTNNNELLGVIEATVYYSGFDCLRVSVVGDNTFNLSAEGAQRSSKISINNTCAEPVRVLDASSRSPDLMFGLPTITVAPGENAHTYLSVFSLKNNLKLENYPVIIRGVTGMSQSPIEAKALQLNIYAGVNFNDTYSKATTGVKAKTCTKEDITISIPKTSTGNSDCSNGYCDAEQASAYLAKKLDMTIKKARSQALVAQKETEFGACASQKYCTFALLNVPKETVKIYLKNDAITAETMRNAFDKITQGSTGFVGGLDQGDYRFEERVINEQTLETISMSPYGRHVFIDNQLKGCGYYEIVLNGSFPVSAEGVAFDIPTITMQARASSGGPRVETKECRDSLENLVNFIPVDKSYTLGDDKGSWLTSIETEKKLEGIAKGLSTKLFGSENRVGQGNGNKIILKEGAPNNALAEVCLAGGTKKTINVTVTSQIDSMNATTRKAFETQIVKMVSETTKGNFGTNCLVKGTDGYNCVRLTDSGGVGGLKLSIPNKRLTLSHKEGCVEAELTSSLNEQVNFEVTPEEGKKKFNGVTRVVVFDSKKKEKYYEKSFIDGKVITDKTTTLVKGSGTTFAKKVIVCAYPGTTQKKASTHAENAYITANGAQFVLKAVNKNAGLGEGTGKDDGIITISTGRLHPNDLIELVGKPDSFKDKIGEANPYYFTLVWNDSSDTIYNFHDYFTAYRNLGNGKGLVFREEDGSLTDTGVVREKKDTAARAGMMSYFKWCAGTSAICNVGTGIVSSALGVALDCGLPAATVMRDDLTKAFPLWKKVMEGIEKIPLLGDLVKTEDPTIKPMDWTAKTNDAVVAGGVGGLTARTISNTMRTFSGLSKNNRAGITKWASNTFTNEVKKSAKKAFIEANPSLKGSSQLTKMVDAYGDLFKTNFSARLDSEFTEVLAKTKMSERAIISDFKTVKNKDLLSAVGRARKAADTGLDTFLSGNSGFKSGANELSWFDVLAENGTNNRYNPNLSPSDLTGKLKGKVGMLIDDAAGRRAGLTGRIDAGLDATSVVNTKFTTSAGKDVANVIPKTDIESSARMIAKDILGEQAHGKAIPVNNIDDFAEQIAKRLDSSITGEYITKADFMSKLSNETDTVLKGKAFSSISNAQLDDIARTSKGMVDDVLSKANPEDLIAKRGFLTKAKALFSGRFLASMGRGIGCGLASNYIGVKKYKEAFNKHFKKELDTAKSLGGEGTMFVKGETYKMVLKKDKKEEIAASYYPIVSGSAIEKEMIANISKNTNNYLQWDSKLNTKPPEKRKLVNYLLSIEITDLIETTKERGGFENKAKLDEIEAELQKAQVQELIYMYTNMKDGQRPQKYKQGNEDYPVLEPWVGSLMIALRDEITDDMLADELKGKNSFVKDKITELINAMRASGKFEITPEIAAKVVGSHADEFYKIDGAWEEIL